MSEYTKQQSVHGPDFIVDMAPQSFLLRDERGREWLTEWHGYHGPSVLNKRTGNPRAVQPAEYFRWWLIAQWWHDQGGVVVDGVGVWKAPPIIEKRYRQISRSVFVADPNGAIVHRLYQGYQRFGEVGRFS